MGFEAAVWGARQWRAAQAAHEARVDALTAGHRARRERGQAHPVEDFLWVYYPYRPARLRRWHPGPHIVLEDAVLPDAAPEGGEESTGDDRATWRHYTRDEAAGGTRLDLDAFRRDRGDLVCHVAALLDATAARPASYACLGLHEWAMLYRLRPDDRRHESLPLRLPQRRIDAVVEESAIRCSHFDAFRFFTPDARPLNALQPTREGTVAQEQPGCLHATMDLYRWAMALAPGIPSELTVDALELAFAARELDMRASPYDVREFGLDPVPVETPQGRAQYVEIQRGIVGRGDVMRRRLRAAVARLAP